MIIVDVICFFINITYYIVLYILIYNIRNFHYISLFLYIKINIFINIFFSNFIHLRVENCLHILCGGFGGWL